MIKGISATLFINILLIDQTWRSIQICVEELRILQFNDFNMNDLDIVSD